MPILPPTQPTRRDILELAGGAVAFPALATGPLAAALAQAASGAAPLKISTIGAGREGRAPGSPPRKNRSSGETAEVACADTGF